MNYIDSFLSPIAAVYGPSCGERYVVCFGPPDNSSFLSTVYQSIVSAELQWSCLPSNKQLTHQALRFNVTALVMRIKLTMITFQLCPSVNAHLCAHLYTAHTIQGDT